MRVLHVIPAVASRYGGPSQAVLEMCRALESGGAEVLIATTDADGPEHLPVAIGQQTTFSGLPVIFFRRQWSESFKYSHPLACWLARHVRDYDVVHIHAVFSHACLAAARACGHRGVPYLVRPLGTLDPWSMHQKTLRKRVFWYLGVGRMLDRAAAIQYTTADEQRRAEVSLGVRRGIVVPLGVGADTLAGPAAPEQLRSQLPALDKYPYVLALSRLHPKKGLDLLITAFLELSRVEGFADWRLVLAGDGDPAYRGRLQRLVRDGRGENRVLFVGWLEGQAKLAALRGASLFVLPSYQENFAIAVVEAMACGVPVLVSDRVNLAPEVTAAGAGWVTPVDSTAIAAALKQILGDGPERTRRGASARQLVLERFTWPQIAEQLALVYQGITNR